jgi:SagB-type dehydrogenase family enzyme
MQVRYARSLVLVPRDSSIVGFNYLVRSVFECSTDAVQLIAQFSDWEEIDVFIERISDGNDKTLRMVLQDLLSVGALVERGSRLAKLEQEHEEGWDWGLPAAMFHFSLRDKQFLAPTEIEHIQLEKARKVPSPALYRLHNEATFVHRLGDPFDGNELLALMARRRTVRAATQQATSLEQVSSCLFAGLGITGEVRNCVGSLPLKMTPSGGARNPFEAFIYARNVDGLRKGFYHYSAKEHSLARLPSDSLPEPSELLAGQAWSNEMPCIVFLVAMLERTMWKYMDPNAYRGVLIEAGHIGQNMMLAGTRLGLSLCPTAAFCHSKIDQCLGLDKATHSVSYALTIGVPDPERAKHEFG